MTSHLPVTTKSKTPTSALPCETRPLDAKLAELVLSWDSPVVGPKSAAALQAYAAQPEPPLADRAQVETLVGKLAMATAQPKTSEAEATARIELYWLALRDLPVDDLRAGFVDLVRACTFLPTPAEVRTAAQRHGALRRHTKSRARYLAWKHEQEWRPSNDDRVDPAEVRALLARHEG